MAYVSGTYSKGEQALQVIVIVLLTDHDWLLRELL